MAQTRRNQTPVGLVEIATGLRTDLNTVQMWRKRGLLPRPKWMVSNGPAWAWFQIEQFAEKTGRVPTDGFIIPQRLRREDFS